MAGKYPQLSPYNFSGNNPVLFVDYDGNDFGLKINHDNKTIIVVANIYTTSESTRSQIQAAADNWNNKTSEVDGYTISFELRVIVPEVTDQEALNTYDETFKISKTKNIEKREKLMSQAKYNIRKTKVFDLANEDDIGNVYLGTGYKNSKNRYGKNYLAFASTIEKTLIYSNYSSNDDNSVYIEYGDNPHVLTHEIGHILGLHDPTAKAKLLEGEPHFYTDGGVMEYHAELPTINIPISDDDVRNVIRFSNHNLNATKGGTHVKILSEEGTSNENSPIKIDKK